MKAAQEKKNLFKILDWKKIIRVTQYILFLSIIFFIELFLCLGQFFIVVLIMIV